MLAGPTWASKQCAWWTILISFGGGRAWSSSFSTSLYPIVQVEGMKRGRRNAYKSDKVPAHHSWSTRNRLKGEQLPRIKIPQRISRLTAINSGPSPLHRASPPTTLFRRYDVPSSLPRGCSSCPSSWMFLLPSLVDVPPSLPRRCSSRVVSSFFFETFVTDYRATENYLFNKPKAKYRRSRVHAVYH